MYMVVYAKIVEEKKYGPTMVGVYFGGLADTQEEANHVAERCTGLGVQGTIIVARIVKMNNNNLIETATNMITTFERLVENMANNISSMKRRRKI